MLRKKIQLASALLLGLVLVTSQAQAAQYGGIGGRPANPDPANPRTESIFIHTIEGGDSRGDAVRVINNTTEEKKLFVYATDSTPSTDGGFACKQRTEARTTVGAWIEFLEVNGPRIPVLADREEIEIAETEVESEEGNSQAAEIALIERYQVELILPPSSNVIIPFFVHVPEGADVGEHNGCILIQENKTKEAGTGVSLSFRTGLRVAVTIPGEIVRELEIEKFGVTKNANTGDKIISATVINKGNVSIDTMVDIQTKQVFGFEQFEHGGQYPILARDTATWNFPLSTIFWGGWYKSKLSIAYDDSVQAGIGMNSQDTLERLVTESKWYFVMPAMQAIFIYLAILFLILSILFFGLARRMQRRYRLRTWDVVVVGPSDSLLEIAQKRKIAWKEIARTNYLKAPYQFVSNQHILVPPLTKQKPAQQKPSQKKPPTPPQPTKKKSEPIKKAPQAKKSATQKRKVVKQKRQVKKKKSPKK